MMINDESGPLPFLSSPWKPIAPPRLSATTERAIAKPCPAPLSTSISIGGEERAEDPVSNALWNAGSCIADANLDPIGRSTRRDRDGSLVVPTV
jgi:hypothetical protein